MRWFFPSWSGDFRLEAKGDDACLLTIHDPNATEIEQLGDFLKKARSKGWIEQHVGFDPDAAWKGKIAIDVAAPLSKTGRILLGKKPRGKLTAVLSVKGAVTAEFEEPEKAVESKDAAAAATVRRPTLCCPHPQPGPDQRASEVLATFCTPEQWDDWKNYGRLVCYGGLSGRSYEILHRHHPLAQKRKKIVWDIQGQHVMHCYDWSVPPAEEVLQMKLTLEHAEHWVRNRSGMWNASYDDPIYNDPFMAENEQSLDGTLDTAFLNGLGTTLHYSLGVMGGVKL